MPPPWHVPSNRYHVRSTIIRKDRVPEPALLASRIRNLIAVTAQHPVALRNQTLLMISHLTLPLIVFVIFFRRALFLFENVIGRIVFEFLVEVALDTMRFLIRPDQHSRMQQVLDCSDFDKQQQRGSPWIFFMEEVHYDDDEEEICSICLEEYAIGDTIRKLPKCGHFYHRNCVDSWFLTGPFDCPVCRCPVADSL